MSLFAIFLSIILVLNAAVLILLILIQLPKKEAGAGLAFGAGATDALFGAGSGNALTKMTKYSAGVFLSLVLILSVLSQRSATAESRKLQRELQKRAAAASPLNLPGLGATNAATVVTPATNSQTITTLTTNTAGQPVRVQITPVPTPAAETPAPAQPAVAVEVPTTPAPAAPATTPAPATPQTPKP